MAQDPPQLLTPDDLARILRTSRKAIYALVERGRIPASCILRIGRLLRFRPGPVTIWLGQGSHGEGRESTP